ncbi:hypothetical protein FB45DRAFT_844591 [Roridomyces roridus]|uniref:BTB domain-containing protein n=1 Tax=Roridomyces roridus TaxID=1738132 RepID=A0AAD7B5G1_9AGAR|nr:hypothetical protein FB45DRAFT_844591 [Roridomyces roridus]
MDATAASPSPTSRVEDLWFSDGTLVIQAETKLFRVAGGILAARSSVFKDMLSIPQPSDQAAIDGCPSVFLHDSAQDVEYFLKAIFDSSFFERPPVKTTFPIVAGVLRLSTKYDIGFLRHRALLHLASASPLSLEEFDKVLSTSTFGNGDTFPRLIMADNLGPEWSKAYPLYVVSCAQIETVLSGVQLVPGHPKVLLSPSLQRTCIIARTELLAAQVYHTLSFLYMIPVPECTLQAQCRSTRDLLRGSFISKKPIHPLMRLNSTESWDKLNLCAACLKAATAELVAGRRRVWETLPEILGLPSWEQLKVARETDLSGFE